MHRAGDGLVWILTTTLPEAPGNLHAVPSLLCYSYRATCVDSVCLGRPSVDLTTHSAARSTILSEGCVCSSGVKSEVGVCQGPLGFNACSLPLVEYARSFSDTDVTCVFRSCPCNVAPHMCLEELMICSGALCRPRVRLLLELPPSLVMADGAVSVESLQDWDLHSCVSS